MVRDEIETVLRLPEILNRRVVGQSHGLAMIAKRIETNRLVSTIRTNNWRVMLCGSLRLGKTETALALAEALYGGEQNMITINMSEFPGGAHRLDAQRSAPGYVGYGEGGRLTEAVRRRPYSVICSMRSRRRTVTCMKSFSKFLTKASWRMERAGGSTSKTL